MRIESPTFPPFCPTPPPRVRLEKPPVYPPTRTPGPTRPLRVLMIVEASGAGTGRHVLDLSDGLLQRGHDIHMVYSTARVDQLFLNRMAQLPGLKTLPLTMRTGPHPSDYRVIKSINQYIHRNGPFDIIHGHSSKGGALARLTGLRTRAPSFYTIHGMTMSDPNHPRWKRLVYQAIELTLSRLTRRIIAVSPEEAREAIDRGFGKNRVVMIPNGVVPVVLTPRHLARLDIGAENGDVVIGFVGRLVHQKAPQILVRAFAQALVTVPQARLAIVGGGPLLEPMRELSATLGIAEQVRLLGERDARELLAGFDLFAMSSRKEGLPYVLLEAMSAGLPLVTTDVCGVEILIQPGVNGEVVPMDDIAGLSEALVSLARDPVRIAKFGRASIEMASGLTIDTMVERTVTAYFDGLAGVARASRP